MVNLFPSSEVFVRSSPAESGFYDLEMPEGFRWIKQKAECLLPSSKLSSLSQPVLMITANTTNASPYLSVYINGVYAGTNNIGKYGAYYYSLQSSALNIAEPVEISLKIDRLEKNDGDQRELGLPVYNVDFVDLDSAWDGFEERRYLADQIKIFKSKESVLPSVLRRLRLNSGSRVLDIGAGMGWTTVLLGGMTGAKVFAVDLTRYDSIFNSSFKAEIRKRFKRHMPVLEKEQEFKYLKDMYKVVGNCSFLTMNAEELFFKDSVFDFVFSLNAFEHIPDPRRALSEILRVLKPGGQAFLHIEPLYFSDIGHHLFDLTDIPWIHLMYNREEIKKLIADSGKIPKEVDNILDSLNGFSLKQYLEIFAASELRTVKMKIIKGFSNPQAGRSEGFKSLKGIYPKKELRAKGISVLFKKKHNSLQSLIMKILSG